MDNMILHKIHFKIKQQQKKERNGKQKCFISSKSPTFVGNHSYNDSFCQFIYLIRKTIKFWHFDLRLQNIHKLMNLFLSQCVLWNNFCIIIIIINNNRERSRSKTNISNRVIVTTIINRKAKFEHLSDKVMHEQCRKFSKLFRRIAEKDQFPLRKIAIVKA